MIRVARIIAYLVGGSILLTTATAAHAAGSIVIPEPTDLVLFSMGVLGVIVGRQVARKKPPQD
jgi:hypothetical protein